ncbi:dihydrolipoyllysine-residue acetyltransferase component 5 of pyruvate dehydrogenase complex, chloroplastic-like [Nicotiana sylvestris]
MTEGKIVSWVKTEGDKLAKGEAVLVVESDKTDMDVESFYDGYLATIIVPEGGSAPLGFTIALLAESEDEISLAKAKIATSSSSQETTTLAVALTEEVVSLAATAVGVSPSNSGPAKMWKETFTPKRIKSLKE